MRRYPILICSLAGLLSSISVAETTLEKEEVEKMIASLENIRKAVVSRNSAQNAVALRAFQEHGTSAVKANAFYLECLKKLRFTDEGKRAEAWRTYRDDNEDTLNQMFHRTAKQLELNYLVLTINAVHAEDRRDLMVPLTGYIDRLLAADGRAYDHIDGIGDSLFVEVYQIENSIDPGDWESDPTNVQGIYDQAILPHMRKHRDPRLVTAWRSKIDHMRKFADSERDGRLRKEREEEREARRATGRAGTRDPRLRAEARQERDPYEEFHSETLPEMKWEMCEDLVEHGFRAEALPLMFDVITEHRDYKEIHAWLNGLEVELKTALAELGGGTLPATETSP